MSYLRNCWYVAAWSDELKQNAVLGRTYLDEPVVLFRRTDGLISALSDRCPHRFAPLSEGKVIHESLQCPYHGLEFDGEGACSRNPYGSLLRAARVRSYPVVERHRAIWIWMGDPEAADVGAVPDLSYLSDMPRTAFSAGYLHGKAHYELFTDNVMDLTHAEYLHPTTLGGNGLVHKVRPTVRESGDTVEVTWFAPDTVVPPLTSTLHPDLKRADILARVTWHPPAIIRLVAATMAVGRPEAEGLSNINAHVMTPESERSTHYFFAATRNYRVEDAQLNEFIASARARIFGTQDMPMIERVHRRMGSHEFWSLKPVLIGVDHGAVLARRRLQRLIAEESHSEQTGTAQDIRQ